jgi:hypothetical protein
VTIARIWALALAVLAVGLAVVFTTDQRWLQATMAGAFAVLGLACFAWAAVIASRQGRWFP